uniref:Uncharacterized protein n=1 Tax=Glossina palpalis gambiensis TaxID=67801 RepID=A0A1B0C3W2_9MUSC
MSYQINSGIILLNIRLYLRFVVSMYYLQFMLNDDDDNYDDDMRVLADFFVKTCLGQILLVGGSARALSHSQVVKKSNYKVSTPELKLNEEFSYATQTVINIKKFIPSQIFVTSN